MIIKLLVIVFNLLKNLIRRNEFLEFLRGFFNFIFFDLHYDFFFCKLYFSLIIGLLCGKYFSYYLLSYDNTIKLDS